MKKVCWVLLVIAAVFIVLFYATNREHFSNKQTAYYIVHSDMLKKSGGVIGIDIDGETTGRETLAIQDVTKFTFQDSYFIASGHRANNNLIIDRNGKINEFLLLDNPNYSGVNCMTSDGKKIIAIMNGNLQDNTYKNLLVIQDMEGHVIEKKILDIDAYDVIVEKNKIYIAGSYLQADKNQWSSKIMTYDSGTAELQENILSKDSDYKKMAMIGDKIYCLSANMENEARTIDILDQDTLGKIGELKFEKSIDDIFAWKGELYGVIDNDLSKITEKGEWTIFHALPDNTYVSSLIVNDESVYLYSRSETTSKEKGKMNLGTITRYNLLTGESMETPVRLRTKQYDNILFYPVVK